MQKFYLILYAVKIVPVTDLVKRLENGRRITKEAVIDDGGYFRRKAISYTESV